ncbi:MAG: DUF917 domain-containing protein [Chloroflexota bacterium]
MIAEEAESPPWTVSADDLDTVALGAGVLGSGGGGPPELGKLLVMEALRRPGPITIVPESTLDPASLVVAVAQVGTPMVFNERLAQGTEPGRAVRALEAHLGVRAGAVMCDEIGGTNSMTPLLAAAYLGLPVVDADTMGRAFPGLNMNTLSIYAERPVPCAFCDDEGNTVIVPGTLDTSATERLGRAVTVAMGGVSYIARPAPSGTARRQAIIPGSYSRARSIGIAIRRAAPYGSLAHLDLSALQGRVLFHGMISKVTRRSAPGPVAGTITIEGQLTRFEGSITVDFQNEYLVARRGASILVVTPDAVSLIDDETGEPIGADEVHAGRHVLLLGFSADPRMTTPEALRVVGPSAFGYEVEYQGLTDW